MLVRWILALSLIPATPGFCQTAPCSSIELPISAIKPNGELLNGLAPADIHAHTGSSELTVKSLSPDYGARRIVVVVDTSRKLSPEARKAEQFMVSEIMAAARPRDAIALIAVRGMKRMIGFGEDHTGFVESLAEAPKKNPDHAGVLDGVLQAIELFGPPQRGDAIVVMAHDLDNSKANPKTVSRLLAARRTRVFGLALGPVMTRNVSLSAPEWGYGGEVPYFGPGYEGGDEDFYPLARDSGGLLIGVVNPGIYRAYRPNDPAFEARVRMKARTIVRLAQVYYRLQLGPTSRHDWTLEASNGLRKIEPNMFLLYPHQLPPCQSSLAAGASGKASDPH